MSPAILAKKRLQKAREISEERKLGFNKQNTLVLDIKKMNKMHQTSEGFNKINVAPVKQNNFVEETNKKEFLSADTLTTPEFNATSSQGGGSSP